MECQSERTSSEEPLSSKANQPIANPSGCERNTNDVVVIYEYEAEDTHGDYDLSMDGILLNGCSQYLFKFSIIVLPIVFLMVIVIGIFETDSKNDELRCKIGRAFIVLGISVGLLALYFLCRYGFHIRSLYREDSRRRELERQNQNPELDISNLAKNKMSKKQLKYLIQNPWHRVHENEPKEQYSNHVNVYVENGLYKSFDDII